MYKRTKLTSKKLNIILLCLLFPIIANAQEKVGLVLSGGGATGMAHIGVLKALEENEIPIDYITGTSAGALVGSLYASGYSPEEIEAYVLSEDFLLMSKGDQKKEQLFLLRQKEVTAEMIDFSFKQDSIFRKSLPTNFVSSSYIDFEMMSNLGVVAESVHNDFDSLFVPFRCVASDIAKNESVVFKDGKLNAAVRASMTFPFYLRPITVDDKLLFDGGLYNNFPADVMYQDFNPDYIIGSNVSYNAKEPEDDDLIGQVTNMLMRYSSFELPCQQGFIIVPETSIGTFNFEDVKTAIDDGYRTTIAQIDSLKQFITKRVSKEELAQKRAAFKKQLIPLQVSSITTHVSSKGLSYSERAMFKKRKNEVLEFDELSKRYFRLYSAEQIDFMMPTLDLMKDSSYNLNVDIKKAKEFNVSVGGHLSSRPVNTGYFGLSYKTIGKVLTKTKVESYFGKFYGSAKASFQLDLPAVYPISTQAYFTLNRWDYFRSFATFFEDVRPSFLVQNEVYTGAKVSLPFTNTTVGTIDARGFRLEDSYYQTDQFTNKDTTDRTVFSGFSTSIDITQNSLNRKQFASSGHYFRLKGRYVYGLENSLSGSTAPIPYDIKKYHQWIKLSLDYQSYIIDNSVYHLGLHGQMVFNSQALFANYTASILSMTDFSLVPDAKTYFLPEYRSPQFIGVGLNNVFSVYKRIDLRFDGYYYQPFLELVKNDDGTQSITNPKNAYNFMASASAIYHSFLGPIRFTTNYFPKQETPFAFQLSFGYILFNQRAIRE